MSRAAARAGAPLGNEASILTPPAEAPGSVSPIGTLRAIRDEVRNVHAPDTRQRACGLFRNGRHVAFVRRPDGAGATAPGHVQTCGSVWSCPVCANVIKANRAELIRLAAQRHRNLHQRAGGGVYMLTLTVRHHGWHRLDTMAADLAEAWSAFVRGTPWKRWRARAGVVGYVRALEVTRSTRAHGWHPHLHILLFVDRAWDDDEEHEHAEWAADRWCGTAEHEGCVERKMGREHIPTRARGVRLQRSGDVAYLSKLGLEVSGALTKKGTDGGSQPFELLLAGRTDLRARRLWRQYAEAMQGRRQLTWSRYIRRDLGLVLDDDDEERGELQSAVPGWLWDRARRERRDRELVSAGGAGVYALVSYVEKVWGQTAARIVEQTSLYHLGVGLPEPLSPGESAVRAYRRHRFRGAERAAIRGVRPATAWERLRRGAPSPETTVNRDLLPWYKPRA